MFKLGSSAGASKFPKFKNPRNNGKTSMLPRLIVKCRPGQIGNLFMKNCAWFKYLVWDLEMLAFKHLSLDDTNYGRNISKHMKKVK